MGGQTADASSPDPSATQSSNDGNDKTKEDDIVDADFEVVDDEKDEKDK